MTNESNESSIPCVWLRFSLSLPVLSVPPPAPPHLSLLPAGFMRRVPPPPAVVRLSRFFAGTAVPVSPTRGQGCIFRPVRRFLILRIPSGRGPLRLLLTGAGNYRGAFTIQ